MSGRSNPAGVSLVQLRERVALRIEATSLRNVAREIGMSASGLQKMVDGTQPYSATIRKLERWYVRDSREYRGNLSPGSAEAVISVLLQDLPAKDRNAARVALLHTLRDCYSPRGTLPDWLLELLD